MREFFTWHGPQPATGLTLVVAFGGFLDAGGCSTVLAGHALRTCVHTRIGSFDPDALYVYSARRGFADIENGRLVRAMTPAMELNLLTDAAGHDFLLLSGPEPDMCWARVAQTVEEICDRLSVKQVVYTGGVEWGAPHTRPVGVIAQGTNPLVTSRYQQPAPMLRVPASATAFMELTVAKPERHVTGLLAKVPSYLASREYGPAIAAVLTAMESVTGVAVPLVGLDGDEEHARIAEYAARTPSLAAMITALEHAYDGPGVPGASTDDLMSQIETFLADQ